MAGVLHNIRKQIRKHPFLHKFIKFCFVGAASAMVSLFVFWVFSMQFPQYNLLGKAIGYAIGFFVGFTLNKFWTYVDRADDGEKYLMKYVIVYAATFLVYLIFNYTCDHLLRLHQPVYWVLDWLQLHEVAEWAYRYDTTVSNAASIVVNAVLNFLGTNFLVFRVPKPEELFD
jgi:putative flippase GtrA